LGYKVWKKRQENGEKNNKEERGKMKGKLIIKWV
jgi:hypothetical protein